jgi:hypothetical protein
MSAVKLEAKRLIDNLPDGVTWDGIMCEMCVKQKIESGLRDGREGRTIPHEEVRRRFAGMCV